MKPTEDIVIEMKVIVSSQNENSDANFYQMDISLPKQILIHCLSFLTINESACISHASHSIRASYLSLFKPAQHISLMNKFIKTAEKELSRRSLVCNGFSLIAISAIVGICLFKEAASVKRGVELWGEVRAECPDNFATKSDGENSLEYCIFTNATLAFCKSLCERANQNNSSEGLMIQLPSIIGMVCAPFLLCYIIRSLLKGAPWIGCSSINMYSSELQQLANDISSHVTPLDFKEKTVRQMVTTVKASVKKVPSILDQSLKEYYVRSQPVINQAPVASRGATPHIKDKSLSKFYQLFGCSRNAGAASQEPNERTELMTDGYSSYTMSP